MTTQQSDDWDPEAYDRFRDLRLRPALDLLNRVPVLKPGPVVDLGCGSGAAGPALKARFPDRALIGIDRSPAMLETAAQTGVYDHLTEADAGQWQAPGDCALIFSNAVLHWLPDHATLLPHLARQLADGGALAIQMPRQQMAPSHAAMRDLAHTLFPDIFDFAEWQPQVAPPAAYNGILSPFGHVDLWETEFFQLLPPNPARHPVHAFTASTAMRPFLEALSPDRQSAFQAAYDRAMIRDYPLRPDGSVLFPFRRLFMILHRET